MKKVIIYALALVAYCTVVNAQSIIDADDQRNPNDFYQKGIVVGKKAMPYPFLRESDVVWECVIWREIDFNEKFNQFFYFPVSTENDTQGRISLINLIMKGVRNGEIPTYEDDDMIKELDVEAALKMLSGDPIPVQEAVTDEEGNPIYDEETGEIMERTVYKTRDIDIADITKIQIKEKWYIDKQDSRMKVRIVGLRFHFMKELLAGGFSDELSFCIPMDDMRVRQLFVNANAYDDNNDVVERSYDDIFIQRYFDSYVVRESNVYNRKLTDYLTGQDAILQSQMIEERIFDIESDMWEY